MSGWVASHLHLPWWVKDFADIFATLGIIAAVLVATTLIIQNRQLAHDLDEQQQAANRAAVETCYSRHDSADALRPFIQAFEREHRNDPRSQQAARNYLSIVVDTAPRISDCRALANKLGVPFR